MVNERRSWDNYVHGEYTVCDVIRDPEVYV